MCDELEASLLAWPIRYARYLKRREKVTAHRFGNGAKASVRACIVATDGTIRRALSHSPRLAVLVSLIDPSISWAPCVGLQASGALQRNPEICRQ